MNTERVDHEYGSEIYLFPYANERHVRYEVRCNDWDHDRRANKHVSPTVRIDAPGTRVMDVDDIRRLIAEYAEVADVAEKLQQEKRAAYAQRFD